MKIICSNCVEKTRFRKKYGESCQNLMQPTQKTEKELENTVKPGKCEVEKAKGCSIKSNKLAQRREKEVQWIDASCSSISI
jgi:hypothetical protein